LGNFATKFWERVQRCKNGIKGGIKHLKKYPCVFGGHLFFMNNPFGELKGYYGYSLKVRGILCL
jgi:hypothetical protein